LGVAEAGEEEFLFRAGQAFAKGFGSGVVQWGLAELIELVAQVLPLVIGGLGPPRSAGELVVSLTGVMNKALDVLTELASRGVAGPAFEQGQFLFEFLGFGLDMREAGLAVFGFDAVVGGVGIGDQDAVEFLSQEFLGRLGGAMSVPKESGQVVIAAIPNPVAQ
jgi:hypothetical protein